VPRDDFNSLISSRVKKNLIHDPYILVFDTAITLILRWMISQPRGERVTMYFHRTSFASKAKQVYQRRRRNDRQGYRLPDNVHFVSGEVLPIQAADLLASLARNFERGNASGGLPITPQIEACLIRLNKRPKTAWRTLGKEKLQETDQFLAKWLDTGSRTNGKRNIY